MFIQVCRNKTLCQISQNKTIRPPAEHTKSQSAAKLAEFLPKRNFSFPLNIICLFSKLAVPQRKNLQEVHSGLLRPVQSQRNNIWFTTKQKNVPCIFQIDDQYLSGLIALDLHEVVYFYFFVLLRFESSSQFDEESKIKKYCLENESEKKLMSTGIQLAGNFALLNHSDKLGRALEVEKLLS